MVVVRGHKFCLFELRNCCGMCKWSFSNDGDVVHIRLTMVTLYWKAFVPPRKSYRIGIRLTHVNGDFDAISMTERNGVTPISKVKSHVLDTLGVYTLPNRPCRVGLLLTALVCHLFMYLRMWPLIKYNRVYKMQPRSCCFVHLNTYFIGLSNCC